MKKQVLLFLSIILSINIFGKEIPPEKAKQIATSFLQNNPGLRLKSSSTLTLTQVNDILNPHTNPSIGSTNTLKKASSETEKIYVFNINQDDGFIIVSGDDAAIPILGYSTKEGIQEARLPRNVLKWLENYRQQILYIQANDIQQTKEINGLWEGHTNTLKSSPSSVLPLIQTKWNQSPYVNEKCPYDKDYGERAVTGCPATAMAQIMKYWEYPEKGIGFHSYQHNTYGVLTANFGGTYYDWEAMPNNVNSPNDAVATLMYHCGVAVEMNYGVDGSSSYVIKDKSPSDNQTVEYALPTYFGYATTLEGIERVNYSDIEWKNILKAELDAGRPIQYAGYGQGGHTFVCDGYDQNGYFHMNWGWGGLADAYYLLDALNPTAIGIGGGLGSYNSGQQALIGIQPPESFQTYKLKINSDVTTDNTVIGYGEGFTISTDILNDGTNEFNGDYCAAIFNEDFVFVDYVEIKENLSLSPNYHYTSGIHFSTEGLLTMFPGSYKIYIYYRPTGGNWDLIVPDYWDLITDYYTQIKVVNENEICLYDSIQILTDDIYNNDSLSVWLNVANFSETEEFVGDFNLSLYDIENGNWVTTIDERIDYTLGAYSYYIEGLNFSTSNLDVNPGTYLLALQHFRYGNTNSELTGSNTEFNFINPIKITVKQKPYQKDIYESNDTIINAYPISLNYISDSISTNTIGSNIHSGIDWDFYSIELDDEYEYNIKLRLHDAYNSGNEKNYTVDGLFQYSFDGVYWSDVYDDVMPENIISTGNNQLYFVVSPYFLGETGTYLMDINIKRAINKPNNAPLITSQPDTTIEENISYDYSIEVADSDEDELKIFISSIPGWLNLEDNGNGTGRLYGLPSHDDIGEHRISFFATDGIDTVYQNFKIQVLSSNDSPTFSGDTIINIDATMYFAKLVSAEDKNLDTIFMFVEEMPSWLEFIDDGNGKGILYGTPSITDFGNFEITVFATDKIDTTGQIIYLKVKKINYVPEFTSIPVTETYVDSMYSYTITTSDDNRDTVTISALTIPEWLSMIDNGDGTARLYGTPGNSFIGEHDVKLVVKDESSQQSQSFVITVSPNTGIFNNSNTTISLYPNPVLDNLYIGIEGNSIKDAQINIYNILGEKLINISCNTESHNIIKIPVSNLKSGIYTIAIYSKEFWWVRQLVKE